MLEILSYIEPEQREVSKPRRVTRVKTALGRAAKWGTLGIATATAVAACSFPGGSDNPTPEHSKSPKVEQAYERFPTVEQTLKNLEKDTYLDKNNETINLYTTSQYMEYNKKDAYDRPITSTQSGDSYIGQVDSAPLIELTRESDGSLRVHDQIGDTMDSTTKYQLIASLVSDPVFKSALANGEIDKVAFRINQDTGDESATTFWPEFVYSDTTANQRTPQKSLFILLPPTSLDKTTYKDAVSHESLHAETQKVPLSVANEQTPSPQELARWQKTCTAVRKVAIDQAELESQDLVYTMEANEDLISNEKMREAFDEVKTALQNGEFNKFQPTSPDTQKVFHTKIPECATIGPWQSFLRLLEKRHIKIDMNTLEKLNDTAETLIEGWGDIVSLGGIYNHLRENTYEPNPDPRRGLGHPDYTWDERIVSSINNLLLYPEQFAKTVKYVEPEERKAIEEDCAESVRTMDAAIPHDNKPDNIRLRIKLKNNYDLFKTTLNA